MIKCASIRTLQCESRVHKNLLNLGVGHFRIQVIIMDLSSFHKERLEMDYFNHTSQVVCLYARNKQKKNYKKIHQIIANIYLSRF
jgi:hypothetical protein